MADAITPHFHNTDGVDTIFIGVKEFMCIGARPPQDHPHVFLDMGDESEMVCPYCSTLYRYSADLTATQTRPDGMLIGM
uniref:zinc-finger domain-containing protein n=1 Tax=Pararhizobium sp. IMCC3301 TaxID=3067904 RepID=UPI00274194B4|nr:zinc-finger domain-containing protein [Pararhizobium sp. IMCC3301]